jgi:hypothetical protein
MPQYEQFHIGVVCSSQLSQALAAIASRSEPLKSPVTDKTELEDDSGGSLGIPDEFDMRLLFVNLDVSALEILLTGISKDWRVGPRDSGGLRCMSYGAQELKDKVYGSVSCVFFLG